MSSQYVVTHWQGFTKSDSYLEKKVSITASKEYLAGIIFAARMYVEEWTSCLNIEMKTKDGLVPVDMEGKEYYHPYLVDGKAMSEQKGYTVTLQPSSSVEMFKVRCSDLEFFKGLRYGRSMLGELYDRTVFRFKPTNEGIDDANYTGIVDIEEDGKKVMGSTLFPNWTELTIPHNRQRGERPK
jgi:hypothetical protein